MIMSKMNSVLRPGISRRQFLYYSALAASATGLTGWAKAQPRRLSANDKLNIGVVGVAGKGASDTACCASENIIALCDVDEKAASGPRQKYPNAKFYKDFRQMLEQEKSLDAVVISTPDHLHATIASMAIRMGKHVYCQKPLTQTIYEARLLRGLAKEYNVATQMGNQGSAENGLRRAVEVVQAGFIGPVRQVYVWSNRPIWPQGMGRPAGEDPVPANLDWDLWLGPAPFRPFKLEQEERTSTDTQGKAKSKGKPRRGVYHPFNWRGWQDFGTGALGDMACHTVNMPFRALKLGYPVEVEAESSGINKETYPLKSKIRFEFPARENLPPVTLWWFDGGNPKADSPYRHDGSNKPPKEVTADVEALMGEVPGSGCLLLGDRGKIFSPDDYGAQFFLKLKDDKEFTPAKSNPAVAAIKQTIPRNPTKGDPDQRQHFEWLQAIKENQPELCYSRFDIAAYLTEIILLGCIAIRVGKKLDWDGPNMTARNAPEAARFVKPVMRPGWTLG